MLLNPSMNHRLAACLLTLALGMAATAAHADGSITFIHGGIGGVTNINNGNAFNINLVNGAKTETFLNKTGKTIKDFHFTWANNLAVRGFDDLPDNNTALYFGTYTAVPKAADFFDQVNGVGIANNEKFEISISGFGNMNLVTATPTFNGGKGKIEINKPVPEPETVVLSLAGLIVAGWALRGRKTA